MTRKKWNRLRRQRPELFCFLPAWEKLSNRELAVMRVVSPARAISVMTGFVLEHGQLPYERRRFVVNNFVNNSPNR